MLGHRHPARANAPNDANNRDYVYHEGAGEYNIRRYEYLVDR